MSPANRESECERWYADGLTSSWLCLSFVVAQPSLLYRGSRDGFSKADFVRCCADKGPTMTLVRITPPNNAANVSRELCLLVLELIVHVSVLFCRLSVCRSRSAPLNHCRARRSAWPFVAFLRSDTCLAA